MELWELQARERIRDTLARYTWSGDAGTLPELALAFCPDGVLEVRGQESRHGRDAIIAMLGGLTETRTPVRLDGLGRAELHHGWLVP